MSTTDTKVTSDVMTASLVVNKSFPVGRSYRLAFETALNEMKFFGLLDAVPQVTNVPSKHSREHSLIVFKYLPCDRKAVLGLMAGFKIAAANPALIGY